MFFFLPWGHDRPTYDRPWATYALVAACVLVHLALWPSAHHADQEVQTAVSEVVDAMERNPRGHISFTVNGLPEGIDAIVQPLVDTSGHHADPRLEGGVRHLVDALNQMPAFRFGWRAGAPSAYRAVTSLFVHADVFHLLGNMLLLWIAGGLIEVFWNRAAFVALYFLSGLAGVLAQHLAAPHSLVPLIGASGAIAGLLGALVVGYPSARIKIFYFLWAFWRPVMGTWLAPAWFVIPLWAGFQLLSAVLFGAEGGGVAYWAHVGGFACGAVLALLAKQTNLIALDAGHEVVRDAPAEVVRERHVPHAAPTHLGPEVRPGAERRSVRPSSAPLDVVVPGERRASVHPSTAPHDLVVPGQRRASVRPSSAPVDIVVPGERRPSVRPPSVPAGVPRPSERPVHLIPHQVPPRAHSLKPPRAISLDELPPSFEKDDVER